MKKTIAIAVAIAIGAAGLVGATAVALASDHREGGRREAREGGGRRAPEREGGEEEEEGEGGPRARAAAPSADPEARALYKKECGACHLDFPPRFLPAASHRRILAGLDRHFGQNAELDPAVRDRLERFAVENAADAGARPAGDAPLRIRDQPWFQREHRRAADAVQSRPSIGSLANCAACHPGAGSWDFDEDRARIPLR